MPHEHNGLGTLLVPDHPEGKVVLDIARDETGGWHTTRGTISGDPAALAAAFENYREARLVHDASGNLVHLKIVDDQKDGIAHVSVIHAEDAMY